MTCRRTLWLSQARKLLHKMPLGLASVIKEQTTLLVWLNLSNKFVLLSFTFPSSTVKLYPFGAEAIFPAVKEVKIDSSKKWSYQTQQHFYVFNRSFKEIFAQLKIMQKGYLRLYNDFLLYHLISKLFTDLIPSQF